MSHHEREVIGVDDRVSPARAIPLGIQHMMSMFGSTVLVPVLTGLDPNVAIMCSGIGTICYLLVTGNKIPSYLGSSFAFISPILAVGATRGLDAAMSGVIVAGAVFLAVAGIIKLVGTGWLDRLLPPVLVASVMVVIGVGLSATAANMAFMGTDAAGASVFNPQGALVAAVTLLAAVIFSGRGGIVGTVPVLLAIIVGYAVAVAFGMVDFAPVAQAAWIGLPSISFPKFDMGAIALIAPVAVVTVIEHIGHLLAVGEIVDKDYRPLLPRSLAGDGLSTMISGFLGGPPTTTYAENIGVMSVTRVYSTQIFWYAGGFALIVGGLCPEARRAHQLHSQPGHGRRVPAAVRPHRLQRPAHARVQRRRFRCQPQPDDRLRRHHPGCRHGDLGYRHPAGRLYAARHGDLRARGYRLEPGAPAGEEGRAGGISRAALGYSGAACRQSILRIAPAVT